MRTRHEQLQAYRFVTRRIVSSMLSGEPDTTELPMRRFGLALVASVIVGAITLAAIGIYGFVRPSGGEPQQGDIIIMRETGARFVYVQSRLHPVVNFTSAQLIVGAGEKKGRQMSRRSLEKVPRGPVLGIPGAPDPAPPKKALLRLPWSVCVARSATTTSVRTEVRVGDVPPNGVDLAGQGMLVTASTAADLPGYLLLGGARLRIADRTVLAALELTSTPWARVTTQFLNSVPVGPDLAAVVLPGAGATSRKLVTGQSSAVGEVYRTGQQHYVMTAEGLAPIGEVMAALLAAGGGQPRDISARQAADALSGEQVEPAGFPKARPKLRSGAGVDLCVVYRSGRSSREGTMAIEQYPAGAALTGGSDNRSVATERDGGWTADRVVVRQGRGALVRALPGPGVTAETVVRLVTDEGLSFALDSNDRVDAKDALGYAGVAPVAVPAAMLALVPEGPALDPDAARLFVERPEPTGSGTASHAPTPPPTAPPTSPSSKPSTSPAASRSGRRRR